ncbi:MAG: SAM-dependent methyltransferase [Gammaproteobacteria bacterium]
MTNNHWRKSQTEDFFIRDSKRKGYRSRSVYKLQEIDRKYRIFKNVESVIDIGSCPGGWSEFSRKKIKSGIILAIDITEMDPIDGVTFIHGSIEEKGIQENALKKNNNKKFELIVSDMSPNKTGNKVSDQYAFYNIADSILEFSKNGLITKGTLVMKVFIGLGFEEFKSDLNKVFESVNYFKPKSSRQESRETYVIAKNIRYN